MLWPIVYGAIALAGLVIMASLGLWAILSELPLSND